MLPQYKFTVTFNWRNLVKIYYYKISMIIIFYFTFITFGCIFGLLNRTPAILLLLKVFTRLLFVICCVFCQLSRLRWYEISPPAGCWENEGFYRCQVSGALCNTRFQVKLSHVQETHELDSARISFQFIRPDRILFSFLVSLSPLLLSSRFSSESSHLPGTRRNVQSGKTAASKPGLGQ